MAELIYGLCAMTALLCAWLLLKAYYRSRYKLLLWSGLCFAVLTINNLILIVDKVLIPANDLSMWRLVTALIAMTLSVGMQADYIGMVDKKYLDSLRKIREADKFARKLLAVAPAGADAYLTLGTANYIIGSLPAGKRFFLRFAGIRGDKREGLKQIEIAAASGRYLRPFAKILLALAALREKNPDVARTQLTELVAEFPQNPLFASELAKLSGIL